MIRKGHLKISILILMLICFLPSTIFAVPTYNDVHPLNGSTSTTDRPYFYVQTSEPLNTATIELYETGVFKYNFTMLNTTTNTTYWYYQLDYPYDLTDNLNYTFRIYSENGTDINSYSGYYGFKVDTSTFFVIVRLVTESASVINSVVNIIIAVIPIIIILGLISGILLMLGSLYVSISKKMRRA